MNNLIFKTESAYSYPLLIKNLLFAPAVDNPDQEIVYRGAVRFSYRQFQERVRRLAAALGKIGVRPGDTVGVMDWDSNRYLECFFAVPMIGAVLHTVNTRLSAEQLVYTISHAEDAVIIVNSEFLPMLDQIKGRIDTVKKLILIDDSGTAPAAMFDGEYESLLAAADPILEFPDFDENTRATTFYSTGTTGMPKGVYFSHRQLVLHTFATIATLATSVTQGRFHREDVYMPLTPMFHVHAWGIPYVATTLGVKQVYPGKYVPEILLKLIAEERVTFSHCVPTILNMLVNSPAAAGADLSRWKVLIGGSALPRSVAIAALKRGVDVAVGYGLSESCPVLTLSQLSSRQLELGIEEQADLRCRTGGPSRSSISGLSMRKAGKCGMTTRQAARSSCGLPGSPRATSKTRPIRRNSGKAAGCTRRTLPAEMPRGRYASRTAERTSSRSAASGCRHWSWRTSSPRTRPWPSRR